MFQIATAAISHMTIGVAGFGCEDALNHLLNYIWPNIFENSPHVCQAVHACLEGMRVSLGPIRILQYTLQVRNQIPYHRWLFPEFFNPV